jgi:hypothetical protein
MDADAQEHERIRKMFGYGRAGEPVPQVDPSDMKAFWMLGAETRKKHPEGGVATGVNLMRAYCKPGANIGAISYRASMIGMLQHVAPEVMDPLIKGKLDAVLAAASQIPMEWLGRGAREGFPFDADELIRRAQEVA